MPLCVSDRIVGRLSATDQRYGPANLRITTIDITSLTPVATQSQVIAGVRWASRGLFCLTGLLFLALPAAMVHGQDQFKEHQRFAAAEARQAVAVDEQHFYAITNRSIGKYRLDNGDAVRQWTASAEYPLSHLNSGVIQDGRLYCAHSNYPRVPEASSVEVWDADSLQHVDSHSFGIYEGSLTWIDWKDNAWWAGFAHYSNAAEKNAHRRDTRWTSVVKFDGQWRRLGGWVFPEELLQQLEPYSCSGGAWGPDGALYCTGHDRAEVYRLLLPRAGSELQLTHTLPAPIAGQGIAWSADGKYLLGIQRKQKEVVICVPPQLSAE